MTHILTTATLTVLGVPGRPEVVPVNTSLSCIQVASCSIQNRARRTCLHEGQPQGTQQSYITQALLLQPTPTDRARLIFIHPSWYKGRSQPANNGIIISPSGKSPHAFNPESYILIARSVFALNMVLKKTKNLSALKRCS